MAAAPSRPPAPEAGGFSSSPGEAHVEDPSPKGREDVERLGGEVDDPAWRERSTVVDYHDDAPPRRQVRHRDVGAEGKPWMRGAQARPGRVVPGRLPRLRAGSEPAPARRDNAREPDLVDRSPHDVEPALRREHPAIDPQDATRNPREADPAGTKHFHGAGRERTAERRVDRVGDGGPPTTGPGVHPIEPDPR